MPTAGTSQSAYDRSKQIHRSRWIRGILGTERIDVLFSLQRHPRSESLALPILLCDIPMNGLLRVRTGRAPSYLRLKWLSHYLLLVDNNPSAEPRRAQIDRTSVLIISFFSNFFQPVEIFSGIANGCLLLLRACMIETLPVCFAYLFMVSSPIADSRLGLIRLQRIGGNIGS